MVVKLRITSPLIAAGGIPMVELATINKVLPGDSPDYLKIKKKYSKKYFSFKPIKARTRF